MVVLFKCMNKIDASETQVYKNKYFNCYYTIIMFNKIICNERR